MPTLKDKLKGPLGKVRIEIEVNQIILSKKSAWIWWAKWLPFFCMLERERAFFLKFVAEQSVGGEGGEDEFQVPLSVFFKKTL